MNKQTKNNPLIERAIKSINSNAEENIQSIEIKLTDDLHKSALELIEVTGTSKKHFFNMAAKYAIYYSQKINLPLENQTHFPTKLGNNIVEVEVSPETKSRFKNNKNDSIEKMIIYGIILLKNKLLL